MSKTELAVIIPTRGRPRNIERVIGTWDFTNAWDVADMILAVDGDDPEIEGYRDVVSQILDNVPDGAADPIRLIEIPAWLPMVPKLNSAAVALAEDGSYFAVGFAGDDHLPRTINWAQTYLAKLRELGTGMVYGDDGYQGKKLSTEWAVTADAVLALGRMIPASVEHMYCDNSIMELFDAAGALRHLPQVQIEHMHPIAGKAQNDGQYQRVNSREQFKRDGAAYQAWKTAGMPDQLATLRALKPGRPVRPARSPLRRKQMSGRSPFPHHFKQVQGATPEEIGITLADFAVGVPADQEIVELGVFRGRTALQMAWGARQGNGAHVTAIDPWDLPGNVYDPPFTDPGSCAWARYWIRNLGFSNDITLVQDFSHNVAAAWGERLGELHRPKVGLLYVDGDHTKQGARRDIEAWAPHLADGAVIAIDDYTHPDWPGVREAVDELVAEAVLAPIQIYHDRLAVTRLVKTGPAPTAITSEGVSPSPMVDDVAELFDVPAEVVSAGLSREKLEAEWERVDPEGVAALRESAAKFDDEVSRRGYVQPGELSDVEALTPIDGLNLVNLKALAKHRKIVLGARKDKRDLILQALRDGQ